MSGIFDKNGNALNAVYNKSGSELNWAYDKSGDAIYTPRPDYTSYSYVQKWASKGMSSAQGFDIYDGKVFWIRKSGDDTIPANCYVWNLSDGSQALSSAYISLYTGHGNNLSFDYPKVYATPAYPPSRIYINTLANDYTATLTKTLVLNNGYKDCDACIDEDDNTILWTLEHTAPSADKTAPFSVGKWDLTDLTDNGDGTYTPACLQSVDTPQPANSYYFQGCRMHDGVLWYANGNGDSGVGAYVFGVDPDTGVLLYTIDCNTGAEPEGVAWVKDANVVGGYALYVGFQGMALRKYIFDAFVN